MKLPSTLVTCTLVSFAVATSLPFFGSQQVLSQDDKDDLYVPGDNPLEFCQKDRNDLAVIERVDLTPNPPQAGMNLTIEAVGVLKKDIKQGAYVNLQVHYGLIRLISTRADLCEQMKRVDLECPLKRGETNLTKLVELPKEIPPGKYKVLADLYTKDDEKITCLKAEVTFPRH